MSVTVAPAGMAPPEISTGVEEVPAGPSVSPQQYPLPPATAHEPVAPSSSSVTGPTAFPGGIATGSV
ncbi:hypothetical protein D3C74_386450 [compost metagenome]